MCGISRGDRIWLIGENRGDCVGDNGYYFFKFCRQQHPEREVYFVINRDSPIFTELSTVHDHVLLYGSLRHALLFSRTEIGFYTHTYSDLIYRRIYEICGGLKKLVYLHHGVLGFKVFDDLYHRKRNIMDVFTIGNRLEMDILSRIEKVDAFRLKLTGYARCDYLQDLSVSSAKKIVYIPTFRDWIQDDFSSSGLYRVIFSLLNNERLTDLLDKQQITMKIYPHRYMQKYIHELSTTNPRIKILQLGDSSPKELISQCQLMITDYSSVSWDFFSLGKPVLFYRFDLDEYTLKRNGYFPMDEENIGEIIREEDRLIDKIEEYAKADFGMPKRFQEFCKGNFLVMDGQNCLRIYQEILQLE